MTQRHARTERDMLTGPSAPQIAYYEQIKAAFMQFTGTDEMPRIDRISATENPYLYPYYHEFEYTMRQYTSGVFIIDPRGFYTPIEDGRCGVVHVERLPIVKTPVYGLTDLSDCALLEEGQRIIIFQGVFQVRVYGWRFIDESFQVKPIAGFTPVASRRLILVGGAPQALPAQPPPIGDDNEEFLL